MIEYYSHVGHIVRDINKGINSVASVVIGPHDLIAIIQGVDADALARIVVNDIQAVEGVTRTSTYMVVTPEPDEG